MTISFPPTTLCCDFAGAHSPTKMSARCGRFSSAEVLGLMDADSNFVAVVTPDSLFSSGRVRLGAVYHHKAYYSAAVELAFGLPDTGLDFMVRFPLAFRREHFGECRRRIVAAMGAPDFNVAWRRLMAAGGDISPETLLGTYVWHFRREEYAWHVQVGSYAATQFRDSAQRLLYPGTDRTRKIRASDARFCRKSHTRDAPLAGQYSIGRGCALVKA